MDKGQPRGCPFCMGGINMAKDDYYTIVARILIYLYSRLKGKEKRNPNEYLIPETKDFPISEEYFCFVLSEMKRHGYIRIDIIYGADGDVIDTDIETIRITQEGIDFLMDNSKVRKAAEIIPMAAQIIGLLQP